MCVYHYPAYLTTLYVLSCYFSGWGDRGPLYHSQIFQFFKCFFSSITSSPIPYLFPPPPRSLDFQHQPWRYIAPWFRWWSKYFWLWFSYIIFKFIFITNHLFFNRDIYKVPLCAICCGHVMPPPSSLVSSSLWQQHLSFDISMYQRTITAILFDTRKIIH